MWPTKTSKLNIKFFIKKLLILLLDLVTSLLAKNSSIGCKILWVKIQNIIDNNN